MNDEISICLILFVYSCEIRLEIEIAGSMAALNTVNSQKSLASSTLITDSHLPSFTCGQIIFDDGQQRLRQVKQLHLKNTTKTLKKPTFSFDFK